MPRKFTFEDIQARVVPRAVNWALHEHSDMDLARRCVDDLYAFVKGVDEECAAAEDSGDFSPEGVTRRRGKIGESKLPELRKLASYAKADKSLLACIEHIGAKMIDPPAPKDAGPAMLDSEIRQFIRSQPSALTYVMTRLDNVDVVRAVLNAPGFLSSLDDKELDTIRAASRIKLHPELAKTRDELRKVHGEIVEGLAAAERMISGRTGMRLDEDGVVRRNESPKPISTFKPQVAA